MARSIVFYTDSCTLGGAEHALLMLLGTLDRGAWAPTLLLDEAEGAQAIAGPAQALGVPVGYIDPMPLGARGAARVPALARRLRRERPDVFHAHLSWPLACKYGLAAAVAARVPAVVGTVQLIPEFELDRSSALQLRALSRGVGRWIAVSRDIAEQLVGRFRWPAERVEVVFNAVDVARFGGPGDGGPLREALAGGASGPVVLTCARLDPQKGHRTLIEAAVSLPGAVFVLAGDGPERPALEALAARLGVADRVRFLGQRSDVPELLAACDVFALPSLYEGSSLAVLEAMAAGRPVVSSSIGGTRELVEDGRSGLLVPPGDAAALAAALRRVLGDAALRSALTGRARERVAREFTPDATARRVQEIYGAVLREAGRG